MARAALNWTVRGLAEAQCPKAPPQPWPASSLNSVRYLKNPLPTGGFPHFGQIMNRFVPLIRFR